MTLARRHGVSAGRAALALLVLLGGCVYYPTVGDIGGVHLLPERGRIVRNGDGALFFVDITNTGNSADVLGRIEAPIARRAQLVSQSGEPLARLTVPGASSVRLHSGGERVALSELTRELRAGEVVIVTLVFEKSGAIGVVSSVE
jgi:copper(I)-binding protein